MVLLHAAAGILFSGLSAVLVVVSLGILMKKVLHGQSQPHLLAWAIRVFLIAIALVSQWAAGATYSLALSGTQLAGVIVLLVLIVRRNPSLERPSQFDWLAMGVAAVGILVWIVSGSPLYGLLGTILADTAATVLGIQASVTRGARESATFWLCALAASTAAVLSVVARGDTNVVILLAPLFSCLNATANIVGWWYAGQKRTKSQLLTEPEAV